MKNTLIDKRGKLLEYLRVQVSVEVRWEGRVPMVWSMHCLPASDYPNSGDEDFPTCVRVRAQQCESGMANLSECFESFFKHFVRVDERIKACRTQGHTRGKL